jgi:hypothetical protein
MKFTALVAAISLALSGALLAGCEQGADKASGGGSTAGSGGTSPKGGATSPTETPKKPSGPSSTPGSK